MDAVQLSWLESHYEETVYFLQKQQKELILSEKGHFLLDFCDFLKKKQYFLYVLRRAASEKRMHFLSRLVDEIFSFVSVSGVIFPQILEDLSCWPPYWRKKHFLISQ